MFRLILQLVLCGIAGLALYRAWRRFVAPSRLGLIVTLGLLVRAICGQILFWISYLHLPFARGLQTGDGLWFFALDARGYLNFAYEAANGGLSVIATLPRTMGSVTFVQTLAIFATLFGSVAAIGLLLNLISYLAACVLVIRAAESTSAAGNPHAMKAGALTLIALSFAPSAILWALQPLKDTYVQFLIVIFVAGAVLWQRAWNAQKSAAATVALAGGLIGGAIYAVTGIRWYLGFILLAATLAFMAFVVVTVSGKRLPSMAAALVVFFVLTQLFRVSGDAYIPEPLLAVLHPKTFGRQVGHSPRLLAGIVERARTGFDHAGGATSLRAPSPSAPKLPAPSNAARQPVDAAVKSAAPANGGSQPAPAAKATNSTPSPAPSQTAVALRSNVPSPVPAKMAPIKIARQTEEGSGTAFPAPQSRLDRLRIGLIALLVPQTIAGKLGLIEVGGGRGLMWFADVDTLVFDALLIWSLIIVIRRFDRALLRNHALWLVVLTTTMLALPLVYTVSNFGTLFRLRLMIFTMCALVPIVSELKKRQSDVDVA